jgi:hypothetical protein
MADRLPVLESGIDYLTATFRRDEIDSCKVRRNVREIQHTFEKRGDITRAARVLGYDSWVTGPLTWGERQDGMLVRISSADADTWANRWPELLLHATRIDLQVTLYHADASRTALQRHISAAVLFAEGIPAARRHNVEYYSGPEGPQTLYIGSRQTEHFARIYDKYKQSKDEYYRGCLRYEVECKGQIAKRVGENLFGCPYATCYQAGPFVASWFDIRGVDVPGGFVASYWPLPRIDPEKTDDIRRLAWLRKQVAPTIKELLKSCSLDVVYYSLGLIDAADMSEQVFADLEREDDAS